MDLKLPVERVGLLSPDWLAEAVRISCFFPAPLVAPRPIWRLLTGREPVQTSERKSEGFLNEIGDFGGGNLVVHQQGGRLDVVLGPSQQALPPQLGDNVQASDLLNVGPAVAAITSFLEVVGRSPEILNGAHRIGFSPTFIRGTDGLPGANNLILEYVDLPIQENDMDILWQVNNPVKADSFDGRINRLIRWQTGVSLIQQFPMIFGQGLPNTGQILHRKIFVRCELDINTFQFSELPISLRDPQASLIELVNSSGPTLLETRPKL